MSQLTILPAVHEVLHVPEVQDATLEIAEVYRTRLVRGVLSAARLQLRSDPSAYSSPEHALKAIAAQVVKEGRALLAPFPQRVINGTGVVIHTNLGRAPLGDAWAELERMGRYCNLEWDAETQKRSNRDQRLRLLLRVLTGAEAAIAVNNGAGALVLALQTLAKDREVVISRSELVEIGGGFRIPEIIEATGCRLREVGTTNRTRIKDYEQHTKRNLSVLLKVHQSNFVQRGFVESVDLASLAAFGRRRRVPVVYDIGSGLLNVSSLPFLKTEPVVERSLKDGASVVVSSADKLLGSVQAGLILGQRSLVEPMRRNPLYRALRLDKVRLGLLDYSLREYLRGRSQNLPSWKMARPSVEQLEPLKDRLRIPPVGMEGGRWKRIEWTRLSGQIGGGSNPEESFESLGLRMTHLDHSPQLLKEKFTKRPVPILGYVQRGAFLLDVRTFFPDDFDELQKAVDELNGELSGLFER